MVASVYLAISKEVENHVTRVFRHTCMYKQPKLTKQWNYNDFVQILYCCLRFTIGSFFVVARCNIIRVS